LYRGNLGRAQRPFFFAGANTRKGIRSPSGLEDEHGTGLRKAALQLQALAEVQARIYQHSQRAV